MLTQNSRKPQKILVTEKSKKFYFDILSVESIEVVRLNNVQSGVTIHFNSGRSELLKLSDESLEVLLQAWD